MKTTVFVALLAGTLSIAACGASATVSAPTAAAPSAAAIAPAAGPARRGPSDELLRYWTLGEDFHVAAYLDVGGLLHTELGRAVVPAALGLAQGSLSPDQAKCVAGAADSAKDLILGGGDDAQIVLVRFDDAAFHPSPCLAAAGAVPTSVDGAREAFAMGRMVVAHAPHVLVIGPANSVAQALAPHSGATTFPKDLSLGPDEYLAWTMKDTGMKGHGSLFASSERFRLNVEADVPPPLATRIGSEWESAKAAAGQLRLGGDEATVMQHLVQAVELKTEGGHVTAAFDLREPPVEQARELGAAASLGVFAVRKYLANAKAAEARNAVGQIAKDYAFWYEADDGKPRAKKKLVSLPPVPQVVPRATKYLSSPADWKPWDAIQFSMDAPQYFQYEVRAAKDGNSADIIARGDLNGDGKQSQFRLHIAIDRKKDQLVLDPHIEEKDPEE